MKLNINERIKINNLEGTIKYVGPIKNKKDQWVGILLDEEKGKNFGYVDDVEYFECNGQKRGVFVKYKRLVKDLVVCDVKEKNYKKKYEKLKTQMTMIEALHNKKIKEMKERSEAVIKIKNLEIENLKKDAFENEIRKIENLEITNTRKDFVDKIRKQTQIIKEKVNECLVSIDKINKEREYKTVNPEQKFVLLNLMSQISSKLRNNENVDKLYKQFNDKIGNKDK
ncbi:hypothetical protein BDAP_002638 [Binucleata daphniae]